MNTNIKDKYQKELEMFKKLGDAKSITQELLRDFKNKRCDEAFRDISTGKSFITSPSEVATDYEKLYRDEKLKLEVVQHEISKLKKAKEELNNNYSKLAGQNNQLSTENTRLKNEIANNKPKRDIADKLFEKYSISDLTTLNNKINDFHNLDLHKLNVIKNILNPLDFEDISDTDKVEFYKNFNIKAKNITEALGTKKIEEIDVDVKRYVEKTKNIFNKLKFNDIDDTKKVNYYLEIESQTQELGKILEIKDSTKLKETLQNTIDEFKDYAERISRNIIIPLSLKDENNTKKIDLYLEYEKKLKDACEQLSIDTNTIAWHRLIIKSISDTVNSNKKYENQLKKHIEILNSLGIVDIYDEIALNNIKTNIRTIEELQDKYDIPESENIINSIDKLINHKANEVSDVLSEKKQLAQNYQQQIDEANNKVLQYKQIILKPLQIDNIADATHVVEKYKEYAVFLGLDNFQDTLYSYQKFNELKNNSKYRNVFENMKEIISHQELPSYMKNFYIFLEVFDVDFKEFYKRFIEYPDYKFLLFDISAIQKTINRLVDVNSLKKELAINLHDINKKVFFENFIKPNLGLTINLLSSLYSYSNIKYPETLEIVRIFHQKPELKHELHKIYNELLRFLLFEYDIQLKTVNIFIENFDVSLHEMTEYSDVQKLPYYKEHIKKISNGVIYDLNSVGISSVKLNINIKPKVVYKQ